VRILKKWWTKISKKWNRFFPAPTKTRGRQREPAKRRFRRADLPHLDPAGGLRSGSLTAAAGRPFSKLFFRT
jgi:hypothetical protein